MSDRRAIVNPIRGKSPPHTGNLAIVAATEGDLRLLARLTDLPVVDQRKLFISRLSVVADDRQRFTLAGPLIGSPYAAMIVETLGVWGVKRILFIGWCGAVSPRVRAGDIIVPERALVDEGTSGHYGDPRCRVALPARTLAQQARQALRHHRAPFHDGPVWTTDAIFRETVEKVEHYQARGALAVEMELSAVLTVARFRGMEAAGILVVSDELSDFKWRPGFTTPAFRTAREQVCRAALTVGGRSGCGSDSLSG